nr:phosphotransferase [Alphaproteobacteria bacterium]
TEDLIFDEPYFAAPMNKNTAGIDDLAKAFQQDTPLKLAAQEMKWRFLNAPEALCHGDLHTGSIMVTDTDMRVIDPEFAFYGPIGFDIGMLLANFVMAYFAQDAHEDRADYKEWILSTALATFETFISEFTQLWQSRAGEAYQSRVITAADSAAALDARMQQISSDVLGFCGVEIIRRILGLAHVADFESIADETKRAKCERKALLFARELLVNKAAYPTPKEFTALIKNQ